MSFQLLEISPVCASIKPAVKCYAILNAEKFSTLLVYSCVILYTKVVIYMYMCTTINPQQLKVTNTKSFQKDAATIIQYL